MPSTCESSYFRLDKHKTHTAALSNLQLHIIGWRHLLAIHLKSLRYYLGVNILLNGFFLLFSICSWYKYEISIVNSCYILCKNTIIVAVTYFKSLFTAFFWLHQLQKTKGDIKKRKSDSCVYIRITPSALRTWQKWRNDN